MEPVPLFATGSLMSRFDSRFVNDCLRADPLMRPTPLVSLRPQGSDFSLIGSAACS
jgi:hypothetical protein